MTLRSVISGRKSSCSGQPNVSRRAIRLCHPILFAAFWVTLCLSAARAETLTAHLSVVSLSPARLRIEGERAEPARVWSFRKIYGNLIDLGERIENLSLKDASGADIPARKLS